MKKRKVYLLMFSLLLILAGAGAAFGYGCYTGSVSVINKISFGDINIGLKEYEIRDGKRQDYTDPVSIMPGDTISKIPCIINYARPCWVRVRLEFFNPEGTADKIGENCIRGIGDDWIKKGEYFYYTKALKNRERTDVFQEILIPDSWDSGYEQKDFSVHILAEAIQAENYTPDFSGDYPWGDAIIQKCVHGTDEGVSETVSSLAPAVEFRGRAEGMIAVPDDFFEGFGETMPGDTRTGQVKINNTSKTSAEIFFGTDLPSQSQRQIDFLKKIRLCITLGKEKIYEGDLAAEGRNGEISLGIYSPGEKQSLSFKLYFPKEMDNAYAKRKGSVKWIFYARDKEEIPSVTPTGPGSSPEKPDSPNVPEAPAKTGKAPDVKTGDTQGIIIWVKIAAASLLLVILLLCAGKRGDGSK